MKGRKVWEIGGFISGAVLIVFGIVAIFLGVTGYTTTRDAIKDEGITFGSADDPAVAKHASQWAGEQVETGDQARAFAKVMRERPHVESGAAVHVQRDEGVGHLHDVDRVRRHGDAGGQDRRGRGGRLRAEGASACLAEARFVFGRAEAGQGGRARHGGQGARKGTRVPVTAPAVDFLG